jgi:hypothetical protein
MFPGYILLQLFCDCNIYVIIILMINVLYLLLLLLLLLLLFHFLTVCHTFYLSYLDVEIFINYSAVFTEWSLKILSPNFCKRHLNAIKRCGFSFLKMGSPSYGRQRTVDPWTGDTQWPGRSTVNPKRVQHTQRRCAATIRRQSRLYQRHSSCKMLQDTGKTTSDGKM